jgi:hypothetical protein
MACSAAGHEVVDCGARFEVMKGRNYENDN